jgi:hypothetical protein
MNNKLNNNPSAPSYRAADSECDVYPGQRYCCLTSCPFPVCQHDTDVEYQHHHKRKLYHRRKRKPSRLLNDYTAGHLLHGAGFPCKIVCRFTYSPHSTTKRQSYSKTHGGLDRCTLFGSPCIGAILWTPTHQ